LWFLWAYFVGELIVYGLTKVLKSRKYDAYLGILLIIGYFVISTFVPTFQLPFQILKGVEVAGFILLGMAFKPIIARSSIKMSATFFIVAIGLFLFSAILTTAGNISLTEGARSAASALGMFSGVASATLLALLINKNWVLEQIGRNSIIFYCVNALMLNVGKVIFFRILPINGPELNVISQWLVGILVAAFCLGLMWTVSLIVHKWLPWSIGAKDALYVNHKNSSTE
jgi:hypothetical protein